MALLLAIVTAVIVAVVLGVAATGDVLDFVAGAAFAARSWAETTRGVCVRAALRRGWVSAEPFRVPLGGNGKFYLVVATGSPDSVQLLRALWLHLGGDISCLHGCAIPGGFVMANCLLVGPANCEAVQVYIYPRAGKWVLVHKCSVPHCGGPRPILLGDAQAQSLVGPLVRKGRKMCAELRGRLT